MLACAGDTDFCTLLLIICVMLVGPIADPLPNWVTELSNVSAQQRWVLLTSLKAATSYQFRVSAVNSVGEGSPSEASNVVTLPQEGTTKVSSTCSVIHVC